MMGSLTDNALLAILIVLSGLLAFGMLLFFPHWHRFIFAVYIFVFLAAYDFIGYNPVLTSPVKLYFADGILLFMIVLAFQVFFGQASLRRLQSPITLLLLVNFAFGIFAVFMGFFVGHAANDILGDFRRFFLYPLVVLYVLSIPIKWSGLKKLVIIFGFALLILSIGTFIRFATGTSWDPVQFTPTNQFRATGYFSGVLISMGTGVLYAISMHSRSYRKFFSLVLMLVFEAVLFASGYRLLWAAGIFVPLFVAYFSSRGLRKGLRPLVIGVVILVLLAGLISFAQSFFPDVYYRLVDRLYNIYNFDFSSNVRYYAWTTAWSKFLSSPIVGVGIGDQFQYLAISSTGGYYISNSTTHNILMSLLYQTGVLGAGLFLAIHISFTLYVWRGLPKIESRARIPLIGMLAGYFSALMMGMVQPMFEAPGAIVMFYLWMGLILNIFRMFSRKAHD